MWYWLAKNKEWLFSGVGVTALVGAWWFFRGVLISRSDPLPKRANRVTQTPTITVSPTFNLSQELRSPEGPKQEPPAIVPAPVVARANLKEEATKLGKIYLQGDIWTLAPGMHNKEAPFRGLLMDVANVPTQSWNIKAVTVKAALKIQSRSYSPLPWLEEYTNRVRLEPAARKTIVLAAGHDGDAMGSWHFVLNHRDNYNSVANPSRMDWTNMAPIPSDLPLEVLLVDVHSGELAAKFEYFWTFDPNLNWPILKTSTEQDKNILLPKPEHSRVRIKNALGNYVKRGEAVYQSGDKQPASEWVTETHDFVKEVFGEGEANLFLSDVGLTFFSGPGPTKNWVEGRLRRLASLIERADSLTMQPRNDKTTSMMG
jgi:hypothetical protein